MNSRRNCPDCGAVQNCFVGFFMHDSDIDNHACANRDQHCEPPEAAFILGLVKSA